jgi:hypothetical protein
MTCLWKNRDGCFSISGIRRDQVLYNIVLDRVSKPEPEPDIGEQSAKILETLLQCQGYWYMHLTVDHPSEMAVR